MMVCHRICVHVLGLLQKFSKESASGLQVEDGLKCSSFDLSLPAAQPRRRYGSGNNKKGEKKGRKHDVS